MIKKSRVNKPCIIISSGTCGQARGSLNVIKSFEEQIKKKNLKDTVSLKITGCHGFCEVEPDVIIRLEPDSEKSIFYQRVKPEDAEKILTETISKKKIIEDLLYKDPCTKKRFTYQEDIPFFKKQYRLLLSSNLSIDPERIEDYLSVGGYKGIEKVLKDISPEDVIDQIKRSGLRGRGGGGFPTGRKWISGSEHICGEREFSATHHSGFSIWNIFQ